MTICLRLPDPLDDRIPSLRPVDPKSRLRQLELVILPPLASILHFVLLFVTELFNLALDLRLTPVPFVIPKQQNSDWMGSHRGLERVLCRVVDQDLCVYLLANLTMTLLETIIIDFLWVPTSALSNLVISSCPSANVVSWDCPVQITVSNIPGQWHVEATQFRIGEVYPPEKCRSTQARLRSRSRMVLAVITTSLNPISLSLFTPSRAPGTGRALSIRFVL